MKKILMIFGGVFVVFAVVVIGGIATVVVKGNALDKEGKQYADAAIPAIVSSWDMKELQRRAGPEFKSVTKEGDWEKLFAAYRRLGKFKEYKGCEGHASISVTSGRGKVVSAAYVGSAEFETGPDEIRLSLIKHGNQWQVLGFRVNSRVYSEQP